MRFPKPTPDDKGRIHYSRAIHFLQEKYGFNAHDFHDQSGYFAHWCELHGKDYAKADVKAQQKIFQEFGRAPDGVAAEPPYSNFWHWMIDLVKPPTGKHEVPLYFRLDIPKVLRTYSETVGKRLSTENALAQKALESVMHLVPEDMRSAAIEQAAPKPTDIEPFVHTILEHFQAEFGPVIKLQLRDPLRP